MGMLRRTQIDEMCDPQWQIDRVVPKGAVSMLYGPSGKGKSFWALDWALCVATERKWHKHATQPGDVVYVAGEGRHGYKVRIEAWERRHRLRAERFVLWDEPVRLWQRQGGMTESAQRFVDHINGAGLYPALVVFDTLGTCLGGADENDNGQMNELCDSVEELIRPWDAAALLAHHTGKGDKAIPRGAQALQDRVAMHAALTGDGQTWGMLTCTKQKDTERFEPIRRVLHTVTLGRDRSSLTFADDHQTGLRDKERRRVTREQLRQLMADSPISMSPKLVAAALGIKPRTAHPKLARAVEDGWAVQPESGVYALVPREVPQM